MKKLLRAAEGYGWLLALAAVILFAFAYFVVGPKAGPAVETIGLAKDEQPIPEELADHQTRGDMERGRSVGATPNTTIGRAPDSTFIASPNWSGRGTCGIEAIVLHVTGPGSLAGMDSWFKNPASQVSATFGIGKDGTLHQYVEVGDSAWHAGILNRPDLSNPLIASYVAQGINPNRCTVGIELLLAGPAEPLSDYPEMQATLSRLLLWLHDVAGIPLDRVHVVAHAQIDSINRATDPYCCVSIENVLKAVNGAAPVASEWGDCDMSWSPGGCWNTAIKRWWSPIGLYDPDHPEAGWSAPPGFLR